MNLSHGSSEIHNDNKSAAMTKHISRFFANDTRRIVEKAIEANREDIVDFILHNIPGWDEKFGQNPQSMSEFVSLTNNVFSVEFGDALLKRAKAFDDFCGLAEHDHSLSDSFIKDRTVIEWVTEIICIMVSDHQESIAPQIQHANINDTTTSEFEGASDCREHRRMTPSEESPVGAETQPQRQEETAHFPCPIVQLTLHGSNLRQAWNADATARNMEENAKLGVPGSSAQWDPTSGIGRDMYHGTGLHIDFPRHPLNRPIMHASGQIRPFRGMRERRAKYSHQVVPFTDQLPTAWTSFSPLSSFIWAAWRSEVIGNLGDSSGALNRLTSTWRCGDHSHQGIILYRFRPVATHDITQFTIPAGQETLWDQYRMRFNNSGRALFTQGVSEMWNWFSQIHLNTTSTWPDALHSMEFGPRYTQLRPYTTQLWRTVWSGNGIQALNGSHTTSYAIAMLPSVESLTQAPNQPEPSAGEPGPAHHKLLSR